MTRGVRAPAPPQVRTGSLRAAGAAYGVAGRALLQPLDLEVAAGELLALVGPNGAGKSTLCRLLAGDVAPTAGRVLLDGVQIHTYRPAQLALRRAVLPQGSVLRFPFTVRDVVMMGRHPHLQHGRSASRADHEAAWQAMVDADVADLADRVVPSLSGGEQSRVAFARVLAQDAPVILLDEPTASLDLHHQHRLLGVCRGRADRGHAVAIVLHDLHLAAGYADSVAVLRQGRLVALGPPTAVFTPTMISDVFAQPAVVIPHPTEGWPVVLTERDANLAVPPACRADSVRAGRGVSPVTGDR